jgi:hypothetical protein
MPFPSRPEALARNTMPVADSRYEERINRKPGHNLDLAAGTSPSEGPGEKHHQR